jgi:hypothetical protein
LKRSADAEYMTNQTAAACGCRFESTRISPPDLSHINDLPCWPDIVAKLAAAVSRNAFGLGFRRLDSTKPFEE